MKYAHGEVGNFSSETELFEQHEIEFLPGSCHESATALLEKRYVFEKHGIFPEGMINHIIDRLRSYKDDNLSERLFGNQDAIRDLVLKYIHIK